MLMGADEISFHWKVGERIINLRFPVQYIIAGATKPEIL
jgi:hypothetical protein